MADNKNNWIAGFVVAAIVAIASLSFGIISTVRADSISTIAKAQTEEGRRLSILEATYPNIEKRLDSIYDLVAKHMGIK